MDLKDRIYALLDYSGLKASAFAKKIGAKTSQAIYDLLSGKTKTLSSDILNKITSCYPTISVEWLLTGTGDMIKLEPEVNAKKISNPIAVSLQDDGVVSVRYFQVSPTATFKEFCAGASETPDSITIIPPDGENINEDYCVFEIVGDSMAPQIPDRAKVLCREIKSSKWHQITKGVIVIAYGDSFVIKRVVHNHLASEDYLTITSDNPDYPGEVLVQLCQIRAIFEALQVLSFPIR